MPQERDSPDFETRLYAAYEKLAGLSKRGSKTHPGLTNPLLQTVLTANLLPKEVKCLMEMALGIEITPECQKPVFVLYLDRNREDRRGAYSFLFKWDPDESEGGDCGSVNMLSIVVNQTFRERIIEKIVRSNTRCGFRSCEFPHLPETAAQELRDREGWARTASRLYHLKLLEDLVKIPFPPIED